MIISEVPADEQIYQHIIRSGFLTDLKMGLFM